MGREALGNNPFLVGITLCFTAREHYLTSCEIIWKVFQLDGLYYIVCSVCNSVAIAFAYDFSSPQPTFIFLVMFIRCCRRWRRCHRRRHCHRHLCCLCCAFFASLGAFVCVRVISFMHTMENTQTNTSTQKRVWIHHKQCVHAICLFQNVCPNKNFSLFFFFFFSVYFSFCKLNSTFSIFKFTSILTFYVILSRFSECIFSLCDIIHGIRLFVCSFVCLLFSSFASAVTF